MSEALRFSERLKASLKKANYEPRPSVVEREFNLRYWGRGISLQATRRWLKGEVIPTQDRLQVLAEWLAVDPHWLRFGEHLTRIKITDEAIRKDCKLTPEEAEAIRIFLALPSDKRNVFIQLLQIYAHEVDA